MSGYIAANGREITDSMIARWCDAYERGEFPAGEHTVGAVVMGRPPLSRDNTATFSSGASSDGSEQKTVSSA